MCRIYNNITWMQFTRVYMQQFIIVYINTHVHNSRKVIILTLCIPLTLTFHRVKNRSLRIRSHFSRCPVIFRASSRYNIQSFQLLINVYMVAKKEQVGIIYAIYTVLLYICTIYTYNHICLRYRKYTILYYIHM